MDEDTRKLYNDAAPHTPSEHGAIDTPADLATAQDSRARARAQETLGDWAERFGCDYDRVFDEFVASRLRPSKRLSNGRLHVSLSDELRAEFDHYGGLLTEEQKAERDKEETTE